MIMGNN